MSARIQTRASWLALGVSFTLLAAVPFVYAQDATDASPIVITDVETTSTLDATSETSSETSEAPADTATTDVAAADASPVDTSSTDVLVAPADEATPTVATDTPVDTSTDATVSSDATVDTASADTTADASTSDESSVDTSTTDTSAAAAVILATPTLSTDKGDYHPGETASIFGRLFSSLQGIVLHIFGSDDNDQNYVETRATVSADETGSFTYDYTLDDLYRPFYEITASTLDGTLLASGWFRDSAVGTYDQCSNDDGGGYATGDTGCRWINGNLVASNSTYHEGDATVQRLWIEGLSANTSHTVTLKYGTTKGGKHAYDFLTNWDWSESWIQLTDLCQDITNCTSASPDVFAIPQDPNANNYDSAPRNMTMRGGDITAISTPVLVGGSYAGDSETAITITFTTPSSGNMCTTKKVQGQDVTSCGVALFFGAHISKGSDWGVGTTAVDISGSPYHVSVDAVDGSSAGERDNQMQANSIPSTITIHKVTSNEDSSTVFSYTTTGKRYSGFTLTGGSTNSQQVSSGNGNNPANYSVTESPTAGWAVTDIECTTSGAGTTATPNLATGSVSIAVGTTGGNTVDCTFTNTLQQGTLIVKKVVVNNNGGTATASAFSFSVNGGTATSFEADGQNDLLVNAGTYTVTESAATGYSTSYDNCSNVVVPAGGSATCTITNDDIPATLTVIKHVVNDNGGTKVAGNFTMHVTGTNPSISNFSGAESPGTTIVLDAGSYSVSEDAVTGYAQTSSVGCSGTVSIGSIRTCTITNDDQPGTLHVVKVVDNGNTGATTGPSAFSFSVNGGTAASFETDGQNDLTVNAGNYSVTEPSVSGYTTSYDNCSNVAVTNGGEATCTITNTAIPPKLTVIKVVDNGNTGSTNQAGNFQMKVDGGNVDQGFANEFTIGSHTITETGPDLPQGYTTTYSENCPNGSISLALGDEKTCTVTNTAIAPTLTLVKHVINDNGGQATAADFQGKVDGTDVAWGSAKTTTVGSHAASEVANVSGYAPSDWSGACAANGTVSLALGENKTCEITNDDIAPELIVIKHVVNDNGGTKVAGDFTMSVTGTNVSDDSFAGSETGTTVTLDQGSYSVDENGLSGYAKSLGEDCSGTINVGEKKTCTITNDDIAPKLTLNKVVVNDNGGTASEGDWTLVAAGPTPISGPGAEGSADVVSGSDFSAGAYTLSEGGSSTGYSASDWTCTGDAANTGASITLGLGQEATCTITNDDIAPQLKLIKTVVNDNGGTATAADWTLTADGGTAGTLSGAGSASSTATFQAGAYALSESTGPAGYAASSWSCDGTGSYANGEVTLGVGQSATCTITNDDIAPKLHLRKVVTNDNGGDIDATSWTLAADGTGSNDVTGTTPVDSGPTLKADTFTLSESGPGGYQPSSWVCNGGTRDGANLTLGIGEEATCEITNDDIPGTLKIVKNTEGGDETFNFAVAGPTPSTPSVTTVSGTGATDAVEVNRGTYSVTETVPTGWDLTSAVCNAGETVGSGGIASLFIDLAQNVICTFTNVKRGHLIVDKVTYPAGDPTSFSILASGTNTVTSGASGTVTDATNQDYEVKPGTYSVAETVPTNWDMNNNTCENIVVGAGETKNCQITNTKRGVITIVKKTDPANDPTEFSFDANGTNGATAYSDFTLTGKAPNNRNEQILVPGDYSVTELPSGWKLRNVSCSASAGSTAVVNGATTNFSLAPGGIITCTYLNASPRMTGGGSVFTTVGNKSTRVTHGFELHCSPGALPNNLEVNWGSKPEQNFHLTSLTSAQCIDDPRIDSGMPRAPFNTFIGTGTGTFNNKPGATASWTFTDAGEPGKNDTVLLVIKDKNGATVLNITSPLKLEVGNQQAH